MIGDYLLVHEYFGGDTGHGQVASHQTGWTALIANLLTTREGSLRSETRVKNSS
jgi:hypothetical protein